MFRGAGQIPGHEMTAALDRLGNDGWEVLNVFPVAMTESATNMLGILLKRPVT